MSPPRVTTNPEVRWLGVVTYPSALALQEALIPEALSGRECLLLLEHEPVYTIGRTRDRSSLRDAEHLPHPVVETNRGGQATFHGPGQLVGYPILHLGRRGRDIHRYLRFLEETLIHTCKGFGLSAQRREALTGVWIRDRKIASLGVGLRKWVSMHGFAINVCNPLADFENITPCGIQNVTMTSLEKETGRKISTRDFADQFTRVFLEMLDDPHSGIPNSGETANRNPDSE